MATSIVQICNRAIARVKGQNFVSTVFPSPEDSVEARLCYTFYEDARDATLEAADWQFASKTSTLAEIGTAPDRWAYQYAWPAGCLVPREIVSEAIPSEPIPFEVALSDDELTKYILTDEGEASLRFTAQITDPTRYSAAFRIALAYRLAVDLAIPLKGKRELQKAMQEGFAAAVSNASTIDANMGQAYRRSTPRGSTSTRARS